MIFASEWKPISIASYQEPIQDLADRTKVYVAFNLSSRPPEGWVNDAVFDEMPTVSLNKHRQLAGTWYPHDLPYVYRELVKLVAKANQEFERLVLPQMRKLEALQLKRRDDQRELENAAMAVLGALPIPLFVDEEEDLGHLMAPGDEQLDSLTD